MTLGEVFNTYREVWTADFEFQKPPGDRPRPICLVARELKSGRTLRYWQDDLLALDGAPYPTDRGSLFVAYYAAAELGCHLALGWPLPERVLDLFAEFRNRTNGLKPVAGSNLLGALLSYGLPAIGSAEKEEMRELAIRGGPWSDSERRALLEYCESDVVALEQLLPRMARDIDLPRAMLRGRYMGALARMEDAGVPIDTAMLQRLREGWGSIQDNLIREVDADYGVYDGRRFRADRFAAWLARRGLGWPMDPNGRLLLDVDTFREMARAHPQVAPLRELRYALSQLRLQNLEVGADGRNRTMLSAFRATTGRNQPSNTKFIFGPSCWLRGLIQPPPGRAIAYVDWSQQEFGIAAALSGDRAMQEAYLCGDPYLRFGQQAGRIPPGATKQSHAKERELFKQCVLGVQYGMEAESLAARVGKPASVGRELIGLHRRTYPDYWEWSDAAGMHAVLYGHIQTVFGWTTRVGREFKARSLRNFPCQANGAEMLRWACHGAQQRGVQVIAPVHDAVLIEAPADAIDEAVARTQAAMVEASEAVLSGFRLRSDAKIIVAPDRYMDDRGRVFWDRVVGLLPPGAAKAS